MDNIKIGAVTIGQAPRTDITDDIRPMLASNIELVEYGALDPYSYEEASEKFAPKKGESVLVSRMRDGRQVTMSEAAVIPLVQDCIHRAEEDGVQATVLHRKVSRPCAQKASDYASANSAFIGTEADSQKVHRTFCPGSVPDSAGTGLVFRKPDFLCPCDRFPLPGGSSNGRAGKSPEGKRSFLRIVGLHGIQQTDETGHSKGLRASGHSAQNFYRPPAQ